MTATAGSGDAWRIAGEDRAKHDGQFFSLKPVNGFISGDQARGFFMQSGLPTPVLGQIWGLADMNNDGKMDKKEFSIAMHLIKKKLQGYELPKSLPQSLKADPSPVMGSFGTMQAQPGMMGMGIPPVGMGQPVPMAMSQRMPMMSNGMPQMGGPTGFMGGPGGVPVQAGYSGGMPVRAAAPHTGGGNLAMPHQSKLKYTQIFNSNDRNKKGSLTGVEARAILVQTGVPQQMLAQIWTLSDVDKDGCLDCEEFCIAMHLIDMVKLGQVLPVKLPAELMPSKGRSGSFGAPGAQAPMPVSQPPKNSFGDLLGNMGMPAPVQPVPVANGDNKVEMEDQSQVTFEDRRKMNFDKGQAELEKRRQMLQDTMKKENEARMEKERQEQAKRDKQRQEQEMKKQKEMERQLEKQRAIERQREEQRQKMMDQREAARRELERQRQMEWERQRKEQLMAEKLREYEQLSALKSQTSNLRCELESLQGKKTDISLKISQVKNGVTDYTAHIEAMRSTRDLKNKDIDRLQREIQELNQKLVAVQSERQNLDLRVQTSIQSNPMSETHRTMMHSVELKKASVQRLKKDLEVLEKDTEIKLKDCDTNNVQLKEMNDSISKIQAEIGRAEKNKQDGVRHKREDDEKVKREREKHEKLRKELEAQRLKEESGKKQAPSKPQNVEASAGENWFAFGGDTKAVTSTNDNWASVFDTQSGSTTTQSSSAGWGADFSSQNTTTVPSDQKSFKLSGSKQKYKAMYEFDARNEDELSLVPGAIVMVFADQTGAEPGWKGGEIGGKCGWFPEAYVEKQEENQSSQSVFTGSSGVSDTAPPAITTSEDSSFMAVPGKMPAASPTPGQGKVAPDGLQAQALYPWKAKKDNHLTFNKGDVIHVREQQDMWWSGELYGKVGWFPKSYVKLISGPSNSSTPVLGGSSISPAVFGNSATQSPTLSAGGITTTQSPATVQQTQGEGYVSVYPYQSQEPGDLTFNLGEVILITKMDGDWWTGTIGDKTGIFPANYVKKQEVQLSEVPAISEPPPNNFADFSSPGLGGSPFPDDPFTEPSPTTTGTDTVNSPFSSDPLNNKNNTAEPVSDLSFNVMSDPFNNSESPFAENNKQNSSNDPLHELSFDNVVTTTTKDVTSPFSTDPFNETKNTKTTDSSFIEDPFSAPSKVSFDLENASPFTEDPFSGSTDPFKDSGDPFMGSGDPFSSDSSLTASVPQSASGSDPFPDAPSDWLESVENDASTSLASSNSLKVKSKPQPACDSAIQTTDSLTNIDSLQNASTNDLFSSNTSDFSALSSALTSLNTSDSNSSASPLDSLMGNQKSNSSPLDNLMGNQSSSASPLDNLMGIQKSSASPLDNLMGSQKSSASPLDSLIGKQKSSVSPLDSLMGSQKSSASPLDSLMGNQKSSASPLDSLMGNQKSSASPLDSLMGTQVTNTSPFDDLMANPEGNSAPFGVGDLMATPTAAPPVPDKVTRGRGSSLNKEGLDSMLPPGQSGLVAPDLKNTTGDGTDMGTGSLEHTTTVQTSVAPAVNVPSINTEGTSSPVAGSAGSTGTLKKPEIATVIASYTATGEEQLSLSPGQLIQVRKKSPSGWWEGELQARGQKRKIGWFPANYVKLLGASARSTPDNTLTTGGTTSPAQVNSIGSATPSPAPQSSTPQPTQTSTQPYVEHVIALYPYTAQNADELTFQKDAVINVLTKADPDWWKGEYNGQSGMFPSNYVQAISPESTSWSDDPAVLALTSPEEGKRQSCIHELINTEETYMTDMAAVVEAFYKPLEESGAITEDELLAIFVNWKDLIVSNTKLQKAFRVRKKMCGVGKVIISIGDILCENIPHLTAYIRFCSCQLNAAALLQRLTENNSKFIEIHKKCVQNTKTKGMPLSSFLLKPMQRITKYPLLVDKILKYTPEVHPDRNHLVEALELCQTLCSQVNEGVREKENSDRLEWIQQHVHCDGLPEKITFNSITNCLGPRKLLHTGVLCKTKSNKELAVFLFNDFLLLTTSNKPLSSATHSVFDVTGQVQYKMYKSPIFLNEIMVKKHADDPESFQVCHIERVYHLRSHSNTDRDNWVRRLDAASRQYLDTEKKKKEKAISSPKVTRGVGRLLVILLEGSNLICSKDVRRSPGVGRLLVVIIEGIDLQACDANGKSDPYCEVSMGSQEHKTKVINNTLNPKWNASMQFQIHSVNTDNLCITVFDRDLFSPNDFLGRTEIGMNEILQETKTELGRKPITKHLILHEVPTGEVVVKLDLHLFEQS